MSERPLQTCPSCGHPAESGHASWCELSGDKRRVSPENCHANVAKGGKAEGLPRELIVVDTGQPEWPPEEMCQPKTPEEVDEIYRWTIRQGIVDHHGVDAAVLDMPEGAERRCATKMIVDFPGEVVAVIKDRDIKAVAGHSDSDLDSITSTYLMKKLVQERDPGALPSYANELGAAVNRTDYGLERETDPEKYARLLPGIFAALKHENLGNVRAEIGKVWSDASIPQGEKPKRAAEVSEKHHAALIRDMFAFFDACGRASEKGNFDINSIDLQGLDLPPELRKKIESGQEVVKAEFAEYNKEFEQAERSSVQVKTKDGREIEAPMLIFAQTRLSPLSVTNLSYTRMPPETIVAAYAGQQREKGGDCYDIGIKPETLDMFDLSFLEAAFNKAEATLREPLLVDLRQKEKEGTISEEEKKQLQTWTTLRKGKEYLGIGDPTVLVAGGSLIAASNTSLMSSEGFRQTLAEFTGVPETAEKQIAPEVTRERIKELNSLNVKVETNLQPVLKELNQTLGLQMENRESGFHVTIFGPAEKKILDSADDAALAELSSIVEDMRNGIGIEVRGIGIIDGETAAVPAKDKKKKTSFLAVDAPALNAFRQKLGLPPKDLHITLGFEGGDIHFVVTGEKDSKGKEITKPIEKKADSQYDALFEKLPEIKFGGVSGEEKEKKQEKPVDAGKEAKQKLKKAITDAGLGGKDLIALGFKPGPEMGKVSAAVEAAVEGGDLAIDTTEEIKAQLLLRIDDARRRLREGN